jgi:hypothetical protein
VRLRPNRNRRSNFGVRGFGRKKCQCQCQVVASCQLPVLSRKERNADNLLCSVTSVSSVRGSLRRHGWTLPKPQPNSVIGGICEILPRRIRGCGLFPPHPISTQTELRPTNDWHWRPTFSPNLRRCSAVKQNQPLNASRECWTGAISWFVAEKWKTDNCGVLPRFL